MPSLSILRDTVRLSVGVWIFHLHGVLREHTDVTNKMRVAVYGDDQDSLLMNIVLLSGDEYRQDNIHIWNLLCPLVYGTVAWDYVKHLDQQKGSHIAFQMLEHCGEGDAACDRCKAHESRTDHC